MINLKDESDVQIWCDFQEETKQINTNYFLRLRFATFCTFIANVVNYGLADGLGDGLGDGVGNGNGYGDGNGLGDGYLYGFEYGNGNGYGFGDRHGFGFDEPS